MNRHCHRIVFNKRRGQLMAVAETTQADGKVAAGDSAGGSPRGFIGGTVASKVAVAMWLAVGALPMAWSQIIADPTAPANQRPTVLSDTAGRPLVNIKTPSAAGLSRNTYKQFDVPTSGIVLNNSAANPWLSNGVLAKTILNEVNSTSQSYLNGAITVNGAAAQVIVANPNGITVNGGSFINASRATLTTGTAQVTNGALTGFSIRGGRVTIGADGFDNSATPYTDIMSRAVILSGALRAQNLGITTGLQTVAYDTGLISNQDTNTYAAGSLTIDTAALGGMYANNISILATEAGLGVRNQGTWQAMGGQIVVTADGLLKNSGSIAAGVISLATVSGDILNAGPLQGSQVVMVSAGGNVSLSQGQEQIAGSTVLISASGDVSALRLSSKAAGGQVRINAGKNIFLTSEIVSDKDMQVTSGGKVTLRNGRISSNNGNAMVLAEGGIEVAYAGISGLNVHLETGSAFKETIASINLGPGGISSTKQTTLIATGDVVLNGSVVSKEGNVHVQAAKALEVHAGHQFSAGQHMSVMAGTTLNLQAASGTTATNGQKVSLSATGNMLLSGNSVTATGSNLSAGQDLSIEVNDGNANLHALSNAGGTSVEKINLSAGKDLNVSVFKGSLYATGLQAAGQNINLVSNGTTSVANATVRNGSTTQPSIQAVASILTAREDLTVGSINTTAGASSQVQVVASSLNAAGQARILSNGMALITAATDTVNNVTSPARSYITAGSVAIQGGSVQTDAADIRTYGDKSTTAKSGDITVTATSGNALFNVHTNIRSQINSTGNIALHANGDLTHWNTQANAGRGLSSTSATGQINGTGANLVAKDVLSLASKGAQTHTSGYYSGGAATVFNETGHLALNSTRVQAVGTTTASLSSLSGQTSVESGGTLGLDANSVLVGTTDLSIIQGQGDITINPVNAARGTLAWSQIGVNRNLTLATRNGNMTFTGNSGTNGVGSSSNVGLYVKGDLNLVASNVTLQGSRLQTDGALKITATSGDLMTRALQVDQTAEGYKNTYWDYVQLVGGTGVNVKAAGNIAMDSVYAQSNGSVNIQSGGNTTIAGNYAHYTVNNQASGGWYKDERYLWRSVITGKTGVNIGAMGGTLTLSAGDVTATNGKAILQALGVVNLQAAQEYRLHEMSQSGSDRDCFLFVLCETTRWTNFYHNEYLLNKPVNVTAQDIEVKAGTSISTYGTKFNASRNLALTAGDGINYFAVTDQKLETAKRNERTGWGIGGLFSIKVSSGSYSNSLFQLSGQPTVLQSQGDILSNSGSNQLLQGTKVSYGGTAAFNAGVGERARVDARIILEGIKNSTTQTRTQEANYVVWQKMVNQGTSQETLVLPSFTGPSKPTFTAPGGLSVQIAEGDFKSQIITLGAQPGMGYLNDLAARKDVNWQPVKLAFEQWDYKQEGLTPAGAALIGFAVAMATGGAGSSMLGVNGALTKVAANAAFTSLVAQASISFINNKGNLSKTFEDLASSNTVKNMVIAAGVAGITSYTDTWGKMLTDKGNTIVTDWAKRSQAYMLNTAAKGVLTGANSNSDWWAVAALGLAGEAYQYWAGRAADAKPGVDRDNPKFTPDAEGGLFRVPREQVNGIWVEGKNIGLNQYCVSVLAVCHGTPISNALNTLPGFNAFATLHDTWMNNPGFMNTATNLGTMPPALLLTYGSLIDQYRYINARRK
jgi:filamentous hemagglutinin